MVNTRHKTSWSFIVVFVTILNEYFVPSGVLSERLDISSFDYYRKFGEQLQLGECPSRYVKLGYGKPVKKGCIFQMNGTKSSSKRSTKYTKNSRVKTPEALMKMLYLCDGKAATYFGLLHKGDCYATEVVNRVRFTPKTYVRVYLTYNRPFVDNLVGELPMKGPGYLYSKNFFLSSTNIGSLDVIILEATYRTKSDVARLRLHASDLRMSKMFALMMRSTNNPRKIKVIRLSTAHYALDVKKFKGKEIEKVNKLLTGYESEIRRTVGSMQHNHTAPHYNYMFRTFVEEPRVGMLVSGSSAALKSPETWENITALEIHLKGTLSRGKSVHRKCRKKISVSVCKQLNAIYRKIKAQVKSVHKSRARWFEQNEEKRIGSLRSAKVDAQSNIRSFSKLVRVYKKSVRKKRTS